MNVRYKWLVGGVSIQTKWPLEQVATSITRSLSIPLVHAPVGRYEEYDGYDCEVLGFRVELLGQNPYEQHDKTYTYSFSVRPGLHLKHFSSASFHEEDDISTFLAWVLSSITNRADWQISVGGEQAWSG